MSRILHLLNLRYSLLEREGMRSTLLKLIVQSEIIKNHENHVKNHQQILQTNCLDFSDPMFKILQKPQKNGGGKKSK